MTRLAAAATLKPKRTLAIEQTAKLLQTSVPIMQDVGARSRDFFLSVRDERSRSGRTSSSPSSPSCSGRGARRDPLAMREHSPLYHSISSNKSTPGGGDGRKSFPASDPVNAPLFFYGKTFESTLGIASPCSFWIFKTLGQVKAADIRRRISCRERSFERPRRRPLCHDIEDGNAHL